MHVRVAGALALQIATCPSLERRFSVEQFHTLAWTVHDPCLEVREAVLPILDFMQVWQQAVLKRPETSPRRWLTAWEAVMGKLPLPLGDTFWEGQYHLNLLIKIARAFNSHGESILQSYQA